MSEERVYRQVDVDIEASEDKSSILIGVKSADGSPLTSQEIIDAVSDVLIYEYDDQDATPKRQFDA